MILAGTIVCFLLLLDSSLSSPIDASKAKTKTVALAYSCMRVTTEGQNVDLPPILLLHGLASYKEAWMGLYQILALKTGRRVCAADLRNHGDSPWSDDSDIEAITSDLVPLLKTLKTDKVLVLGHSLGGKIAVHFALKHPEKVEKIIVEDMRPNGLTDTAMKGVLFVVKVLIESTSAIPKGANEREAKLAVFQFVKKSFEKINASFPLEGKNPNFLPIKCSMGKCGWRMNIEIFKKYLKNPKSFMAESTGLFDKPALFIYGTASQFKVGDDKEAILKLFPKAKIVGVEGAGHLVNNRPEYLEEVITFINPKEQEDF